MKKWGNDALFGANNGTGWPNVGSGCIKIPAAVISTNVATLTILGQKRFSLKEELKKKGRA